MSDFSSILALLSGLTMLVINTLLNLNSRTIVYSVPTCNGVMPEQGVNLTGLTLCLTQRHLPQRLRLIGLLSFLGVCGAIAPASAQIAPATVNDTQTIVTPNGNQLNITGGTQAGDNLFHSFQQFGLNANQIANFITNPAIQNVLARVVGGNPSLINGLIQLTGSNANLYLMNPAGIVFGAGASLNVPAAFTATTASGLGFGNQWFNAIGTNNYAALVGSPDSFAFAIAQPGVIVNAGSLTVGQGQQLNLVGGLVVNTGTLTAPEGQITIVAVPGTSLVRLSQPGSLLSFEFQPLPSDSGNLLPFTPATLPQLLTGDGPIQNATGLSVNPNGQVVLSGSGVAIPSDTGSTVLAGATNLDSANIVVAAANDIAITALTNNQLNFTPEAEAIEFRADADRNGIGSFYMNPTNTIQAFGRDLTILGANITAGTITTRSNNTAGSISLTAYSPDPTQGNITLGLPEYIPPGETDPSGKLEAVSRGTGNGGKIELHASGTITTGPLRSSSDGGSGGNIIIDANGSITLNCPGNTTCVESFAQGNTTGQFDDVRGNSGNITLTSHSGNIQASGATLNTSTGRPGQAGFIDIYAYGDITIDNLWSRADAQNSNFTSASIPSFTPPVSIRVRSATGSINTSAGFIDTNNNGRPEDSNRSLDTGAVILEAARNIYTGSIDTTGITNGGAITLFSHSGIIDTTAGTIRSNSTEGTSGDVTLTAGGAINAGAIDASGITEGAIVNLQGSEIRFNDALTIGSTSGNRGTLVLNAPGAITLPASITTNGANIISPSPIATLSGLSTGSTINTGGGDLSLSFASDFTLGQAITINTNGGAIDLSSTGNLTIQGTLNSSSTTDSGGNIRLNSDTGAVTSTDLNLSGVTGGGNLSITAKTAITTGQINTGASSGNGGNVTLDPSGNVEVDSINAQGGDSGRGGTVTIVTGRFFLASGTFTDRNGRNASISTSGGAGGGDITIYHDGGDRLVPFNVTNLEKNGTAGVITSGEETIAVGQFLGPYRQGNIGLITSPQPAILPFPIEELIPDNTLLDSLRTWVPPELNNTLTFERFLGGTEPRILTLADTKVTLQSVEDSTGVRPAIIYVGFTPFPDSTTPTNNCEPGKPVADPYRPGKFKECQCIPVELPPDPDGWEKTLVEYQPSPCDRLTLTLVTSHGNPVYVPLANAPRYQVERSAASFREAVSDRSSLLEDYQKPGKQLHAWLVKPLVAVLQERNIQNLSFLFPARLRLLPIAALIDENNQFLIQTYSTGLMPSLSLVDTRRVEIKTTEVLAMAAATFPPDQHQKPLSNTLHEVESITPELWPGKRFLNSDFTLSNLSSQRRLTPFGIIHLATHGEFTSGTPDGFYVQLWNQKLYPDEMRSLGWNQPPVELLVLSACKTAYGNNIAEIGFAGAASRVGVKSIIGSLWSVDDASTTELMKAFYQNLSTQPIKADALAKAQQAMLKTELYQHPYYWSAFTLVGNPW